MSRITIVVEGMHCLLTDTLYYTAPFNILHVFSFACVRIYNRTANSYSNDDPIRRSCQFVLQNASIGS